MLESLCKLNEERRKISYYDCRDVCNMNSHRLFRAWIERASRALAKLAKSLCVFDEPARKSLVGLSTPGDPSHTMSVGSRHALCLSAAQKRTKTFLTLPSTCWTSLRMTLKRTVLERGRHWPTVTTSPILIRKAGEQ